MKENLNKEIHVATTANEAYAIGLIVTLLSCLVANSGKNCFQFHVFDTGMFYSTQKKISTIINRKFGNLKIHFYKIDKTSFEGLTLDYGGGYSAYAKLLMGRFINAGKAIYVDSDFLILRDVAELYFENMGGNVMLATRDVDTVDGKPATLAQDCPFDKSPEVLELPYFNSGMLLVDLKEWNRLDIERKSFEAAKGHEGSLRAWDQTILNYVLRGKIGSMDSEFARSRSWDPLPRSCNIHFISKSKPWNTWSFMASFRLWRAFHKIFIGHSFPCRISPLQMVLGSLKELRDFVLAYCPFFKYMYFGVVKKSKRSSLSCKLHERWIIRMAKHGKDWSDMFSIETARFYRNRWMSRISISK